MIWLVLILAIWNFGMHLYKEGQIADLKKRIVELEGE